MINKFVEKHWRQSYKESFLYNSGDSVIKTVCWITVERQLKTVCWIPVGTEL